MRSAPPRGAPLVEGGTGEFRSAGCYGGCLQDRGGSRPHYSAECPRGVRFFAPDVAFDDAEKYLPPLLKKRGKPHADFSASLEYLRNIIETVTPELYAVFESEARERLRGRDESAWPILATALGLASAVWTEDADFFGTGVAVWTTNRIEIFLKEQAK